MCEGLSELLGVQGPFRCSLPTPVSLLGSELFYVPGGGGGVLSIHSSAVREHSFPRTPFSKPCHLEGLGTEVPWTPGLGGCISDHKLVEISEACTVLCVCERERSLVEGDFEMPGWGEEEVWRQG